MNAQHTLGPWLASDFGGNRVLIHVGTDLHAPNSRIACVSWGNSVWADSYIANTRLIAAAPDYYSATENVLIETRLLGPTSQAHIGGLLRAIRNLHAAHAKATGGAA